MNQQVSRHLEKSAMQNLLDTGKYSDFTLVCNGHDETPVEIAVHRAIICPQSDFFEAACGGSFLEADTRKVNISGDDLASIRYMLLFMYTGDYREKPEHQSEEGDGKAKKSDVQQLERPHTSTRVYAVADKYGVFPLMDVAKERFKLWVSLNWASEELPAIAKEVFETTPEMNAGLRDLVADIVAEHIGVLILRDFWCATLESSNQLSFMVLRRTVSSTARLKRAVATL